MSFQVPLLEDRSPRRTSFVEKIRHGLQAGSGLLIESYHDVGRIGRRCTKTNGIEEGCSDEDFAHRTPDLVFVFPHPEKIASHHEARKKLKKFYMQHLLDKVWKCDSEFFKLRLGEFCSERGTPKTDWFTEDDWEQYLVHPVALRELSKERRAHLKEKLKNFLKEGYRNPDFDELKVAVETAIGLLIDFLETHRFEYHCYVFGDNRLAILATWNNEGLSEYAECKSYPVRIDPKKLLELDDPKKLKLPDRGAFVAYRETDLTYLEKIGKEHNRNGVDQSWPPHEICRQVLHSKDCSALAHAYISERFNINSWVDMGVLKGCFLPHYKRALVDLDLEMQWDIGSLSKPNLVDIEGVYDYFGSQVAYYFTFVQFTCFFAGRFSAITLAALFVRYAMPDDFAGVDVGFILHGLLAAFTGVIFVVLWVRQRSRCEASWHHRAPQIDPPLAQGFRGRVGKSELDPNQYVEKPHKSKKICGYFLGWTLTFFYVIFIITMCFWHFNSRSQVLTSGSSVGEQTFFDLWFAAQIKIIRMIWQSLAPMITALEHHKLQHNFNESLETHLSVVFFFNTIFPFIYVGIILPLEGKCPVSAVGSLDGAAHDDMGCFLSLKSAFRMLIIAECATSFNDLLEPIFKVSWRLAWADGLWSQRTVPDSFLEQQHRLPDYTGIELSRDYQQIIIPVMYLFMFAQVTWAYPVLFLWLVSMLQRSLDFWKLLRLYRRPIPTTVIGIGKTRLHFLKFISYLSIYTNWALVSIYCKPFNKLSRKHQLFVFLGGVLLMNIAAFILMSKLCLKHKDRKTKLMHKQYDYQRNLLRLKSAHAQRTVGPSDSGSPAGSQRARFGTESIKFAASIPPFSPTGYWEDTPFHLENKWFHAVTHVSPSRSNASKRKRCGVENRASSSALETACSQSESRIAETPVSSSLSAGCDRDCSEGVATADGKSALAKTEDVERSRSGPTNANSSEPAKANSQRLILPGISPRAHADSNPKLLLPGIVSREPPERARVSCCLFSRGRV